MSGPFSGVSDTGIEPATSSVSGKRATAAPIALTENFFGQEVLLSVPLQAPSEVATGFEPV